MTKPPAVTGDQPRHPSALAGALAGLLAAAVAMGIAQLAAGLTVPQSSPVLAVGQAAIDLTPPAVKDFAISTFGADDKTALLIGILVVLAAFAVVIGMLAGLLNGAAFGRNVVDFNQDLATPNNGGHMIFAMRLDCFRPPDEFKRDMDRSIREIRASQRMEGVDRIWLPGEMEFHAIRERRERGIPIAPAVVRQLRDLADALGLPFTLTES